MLAFYCLVTIWHSVVSYQPMNAQPTSLLCTMARLPLPAMSKMYDACIVPPLVSRKIFSNGNECGHVFGIQSSDLCHDAIRAQSSYQHFGLKSPCVIRSFSEPVRPFMRHFPVAPAVAVIAGGWRGVRADTHNDVRLCERRDSRPCHYYYEG